MMATASDNNTDDTEEEIESTDDDIYRRKYQLLLERCEVLQQDNERLVHRTQQVKKLLRRGRRDRKLLMERLDKHVDNWRNVPITFELEEMLGFHQAKVSQGPQRSNYNTSAAASLKASGGTEKVGRKANPGGGGPTKRKASKAAESGVSKRRANANLQYSQEQRPLAVANSGQSVVTNSSDVDPSKHELSRQLATMKWNSVPQEEKKVFL